MSSSKNLFIYLFFLGHNTKMLEITIGNCHKCDLEIIIDPNNSEYFGLIEEI